MLDHKGQNPVVESVYTIEKKGRDLRSLVVCGLYSGSVYVSSSLSDLDDFSYTGAESDQSSEKGD